MKSEFASANLTAGQLNAIVKKLGGHEGALRFLRGETLVTKPERKWCEQDGIIYFSVTSDGTTGEEWIRRLEKNGFRISDYAKNVLRSKDFKPSSGVTTQIVVLKSMLWNGNDRITKNIRAKALELGLATPNAEVACLIRDNFSDKEIKAMGLWWIVVMHELIKDSNICPRLLKVHRGDGGSWLHAIYDDLDSGWDHYSGFAFVLSLWPLGF